MLIVNADDWGRSKEETDAALTCFSEGRVTSVTAMVFMADSARAAAIALAHNVPVGLHLNLDEPFTAPPTDGHLVREHLRVMRFLNQARHPELVPNVLLRRSLQAVFAGQLKQFVRLYGKAPTHFDGHRHLHLCASMLVARPIPAGEKVRRTFSFTPSQKGLANWLYRRALDRWIIRRYRTTDYFFALSQQLAAAQIVRVTALARAVAVELMVHPAMPREREFLLGADARRYWSHVSLGHYGDL